MLSHVKHAEEASSRGSDTVVAIVSIGTNSTRALVADLAGEQPVIVYANSIGTRIGEGLREKGALQDEAMRRTLEAAREHRQALAAFHPRTTVAISTSALRRASNGAAFGEKIESLLGTPLHVLSGEEEAIASYRGAITALDAISSAGVVDIGGGSTEYAIGNGAIPERVVSCETGAVRLTEAFPVLAGASGAVDALAVIRARAVARNLLSPVADFPPVERLAVVGGSATTTVSLLRGTRERFDRAVLSREAVKGLLARLLSLTLENRRALPGMNPQRADILPAGLLILDALFEITGHTEAVVTARDLLLGYLLIHEGKNHNEGKGHA